MPACTLSQLFVLGTKTNNYYIADSASRHDDVKPVLYFVCQAGKRVRALDSFGNNSNIENDVFRLVMNVGQRLF